MDIRKIAYNLIIEWDLKQTYPNLALKEALRSIDSERDRRFITAIVYGVVEKKITLDHFIKQYAQRPIDKMDVEIRAALRMGIYQMFYMNIPDSAACDTTVELVRQCGKSHSCGFVNAILRNCAQNKETLLLLKKADYSVRFSIAPSIVDLLLEQYGKEVFLKIIENISKTDNCIHLFHNVKRGSENQFVQLMNNERVRLLPTEIPHLFKAEKSFAVEKSAAFQAGWYHIIGKNSAKAASLVSSDADTVMDLCAAPGGKTFAMASLCDGNIMAFDIHPHKVQLLQRNADRLMHTNVSATCMDASVFDEKFIDSADFILCDVPCSGLGIMGKKPDIKYKEYVSSDFTELQYQILKNASKYLRNGGRLVYSTCTLDQRENEMQIQRFLEETPNFHLEKETLENGFQTYLPLEGEDGFFIAVLRKA